MFYTNKCTSKKNQTITECLAIYYGQYTHRINYRNQFVAWSTWELGRMKLAQGANEVSSATTVEMEKLADYDIVSSNENNLPSAGLICHVFVTRLVIWMNFVFSQFRESGHNPDANVAVIIEIISMTARADILCNLFQYHYNINLRPNGCSIILNVSSYTPSIAIRMVNELVGCFCRFRHFFSILLCSFSIDAW